MLRINEFLNRLGLIIIFGVDFARAKLSKKKKSQCNTIDLVTLMMIEPIFEFIQIN